MRIALDTNILVYAEGVNGPIRARTTAELIGRLARSNTFLPVQVLGELFGVLVRKSGLSATEARIVVQRWQKTFPIIETSSEVLDSAMEVAVTHRIGIWDAVILAAAASAECRLLLSEDLQDGFTWRGVTVANPFAAKKQELLAAVLRT